MSTSGLNQQYIPNTLDGLNVIEADQIYIDGQLVNLDNLVPYTGATQPIDAGSQPVRSSHIPSSPNDLINLTALVNAISNQDTTNFTTFLDKITLSSQTVNGNVSFQKGLSTIDNTDTNLASRVTIGTNYQSVLDAGTVVVSQYLGTITNAGGVYQATTQTGGDSVLSLFSITAGQRASYTISFRVYDPVDGWFIELYQSADNINPYNGIIAHAELFPTGDNTFHTLGEAFTASTTGYICARISSSNPSATVAVEWKDMTTFGMGVEITNATYPSLTADRVAVLNDRKQLVSSGISITKLDYLDNVSSDIQTQLNSKASTSYVDTQDGLRVLKAGDTMTGHLDMGGNKVTTTYVPVNGADLINKTYGDATYLTSASIAGLVPYTGATQGLDMTSFFLRTSYAPVAGSDVLNKTYGDATYATSASLGNYLPLTGGTLTGNLTIVASSTPLITSVNGLNAPTTENIRLVSNSNHYDEKTGETYLFTGGVGYMMVGRNTTRDASTANLMIGAPSTNVSEIISTKSDGSGFLPLNFAGSSYYFLGGSALFSNDAIYRQADVSVKRDTNASFAVVAGNEIDNAIIYLGTPFNPTVLNGSGSAYKVALIADGNGSGLGWSTADLHFCLNGSTGGTANDYTNSASITDSKMVIKTNGRVGIGMTDPGTTLDVNGTGRVRGSFYVGTEGNASSQIYFGGVPGDAAYDHCVIECRSFGTGEKSELLLFKGNDNSNGAGPDRIRLRGAEIAFDTYPSATTDRTAENIRMTIKENGRVGINTTDPGHTLDVNGGIRVYGNGTGGPAYVYSENANAGDAYALMYLRNNNAGSGCYWFMNSTTRSGDGGANTATLRNDAGWLRLQSQGGFGINIQASTGAVNVAGDNTYAVPNNYMARGSLTIGSTDRNYGGGYGWSSSTAGLMMECSDTTEIAIHDSGTRVASLMYYYGPSNYLYMGRDAGWGATTVYVLGPFRTNSTVTLSSSVYAGSVTTVGGGCGQFSQGWDRFLCFANGSNTSGGYFYYNQTNNYGTISDRRIKKDFQRVQEDQSIAFLKALEPTSFCLKEGQPVCEKVEKMVKKKVTKTKTDPDGVETEVEEEVDEIVEEEVMVTHEVCSCRQDGWVAQNVLEACKLSGASKSVINHWADYEKEQELPEAERKTLIGVSDRPILSHTVNVVKALMARVETLEKREVMWESHARQQEQAFKDYKLATDAKIEKLANLLSQLISQ